MNPAAFFGGNLMAPPRRYSNQAIMAALTEKRGLVFLAAKALGCEPRTIRNRMRVSPEVADHLAAVRGEVVDTAEQRLFARVDEGDPWAIGFVLERLGRDRGYVKQQEIVGKGGGPVELVEVVVRDRREAVALLEYIRREGEEAPAPGANGEANGHPPDPGAG